MFCSASGEYAACLVHHVDVVVVEQPRRMVEIGRCQCQQSRFGYSVHSSGECKGGFHKSQVDAIEV